MERKIDFPSRAERQWDYEASDAADAYVDAFCKRYYPERDPFSESLEDPIEIAEFGEFRAFLAWAFKAGACWGEEHPYPLADDSEK